MRHIALIVIFAASPASAQEAAQPPRPVVLSLRDAGRSNPEFGEAFQRLLDEAPAARRGDQTDDYHGATVADPYRWMEDPNSEETKAFVAAQDKRTDEYFAGLKGLEPMRRRVRELIDFRRPQTAMQAGSRYIHRTDDASREQQGLLVSDVPGGPRRVLLDPMEFSKEGRAALSNHSFSRDGRFMAYALSWDGSDWMEWRVREVETGQDLPELLRWSKFGGADWKEDGSGFYYTRYAQPPAGREFTAVTKDAKMYLHRLGTSQDEDELVHDDEGGKAGGFSAQELDGYLVVQELPPGAPEGAPAPGGRVWIRELSRVRLLGFDGERAGLTPLFADQKVRSQVVGSKDGTLFVLTDMGAPRGRLLAVDAKDKSRWRVLIPESPTGAVLSAVNYTGSGFAANWTVHAASQLELFDLEGRAKGRVPRPGLGSAQYDGMKDGQVSFRYQSFLEPPAIYRYDPETGRTRVHERSRPRFDAGRFEVKRFFVRSKDGTKVPLWVAHKKGIKLDGSNPTYLYGYGGFEVPLAPTFSASRVAFMEKGGVYALANLRGGSEYGADWHDQGKRGNKQNVFDDFIAASEWLIAKGYARANSRNERGTLSVGGGSNGGLLVGAVMTQRPDLYGAAIPEVGVLDMLRYQDFTVGWGWTGDYHESSDPEGFKNLIGYSPLHAVKPGARYPATLIVTGDHDDRVVPSHSLKYAAELQRAQGGPAPILLDVQKNAGHGAGKTRSQSIEAAARLWSFVLDALGRK